MKYPYLKCYFCRHKAECVLEALDKQKLRCKYNTFFSIYKWIVRIVIVTVLLTILGGSPTYLIMHWEGGHNTNPTPLLITSEIFVILELIAIVIVSVFGLYCLNDSFREKGGVFFGKEKR